MYWLTRVYPFARLGRNIYFHGNRQEKRIALTFDDGPSRETKKVLDTLIKYKARGTFFVLGRKVEGNERILRNIIEYGSEIGNHSYNHPSLIFKPQKLAEEQIQRTDKELKKLKIKTKLFRPPHGNFGYNLLSVANRLDKRVILWDVDPRDWSRPGVEIVTKYILSHVKNGSIVDLHDFAEGVGENSDLGKILEGVIPELQNRGYELVTVSELLNL